MRKGLFAQEGRKMTLYYGNYEPATYPLAAHIWGHRLRTGQHWIEYMLEFLSVLSGFDYRLGQGLSDHAGVTEKYRIPKRLGLRRFIFYDQREKNRNPYDDRAIEDLYQKLSSRILATDGSSGQTPLEQVRSLLRSFSVVEANRSWYAKTLFPVHEEFLLWEGQRSRSVELPLEHLALNPNPDELDRGIEFTTRNFFARGGEIYYLIISAGTEGRPDQRTLISQRLRQLLTGHNQSLGQIASAIDTTWQPRDNDHADSAFITLSLGWIPQPDCTLYQQIADDLATFLMNDLDSLECLELLAHLIGFHIICYIYHHANPHNDRSTLLIDLLGDQDGGVLRGQSAALLREQEDRQLRRAQKFVEDRVREWVNSQPKDRNLLDHLEHETKVIFQLGQTRTKGIYDRALKELRLVYEIETDRDFVLKAYIEKLFKILEVEFRKNFLGIHRKIGRAIGLIAPIKGPQPRFVLGDNLLKTLVMANLKPKETLSFGEFLERLYTRYGIIIGPGESRTSQLIERLRINEEYYSRNRDVLRERMRRAGLLTEYSDTTAIVRRRS